MTREEEIQERLNKATPGPWLTPAETGDPYKVEVIDHEGCQVWPWASEDDMVFAYAAREDVAYLLEENKRLRDHLQNLYDWGPNLRLTGGALRAAQKSWDDAYDALRSATEPQEEKE